MIEPKGLFSATLGRLHYHWDFGNGLQTSEVHPKVYFGEPGIYTVQLIITDSISLFDTLRQTFIVPDSCYDTTNLKPIQNEIQSIGNIHPGFLVYLNPTKGMSTILMDRQTAENTEQIEVFSIVGIQLESKKLCGFQFQHLDLTNYIPGVYLIKILMKDGKSFSSKIIKSNKD